MYRSTPIHYDRQQQTPQIAHPNRLRTQRATRDQARALARAEVAEAGLQAEMAHARWQGAMQVALVIQQHAKFDHTAHAIALTEAAKLRIEHNAAEARATKAGHRLAAFDADYDAGAYDHD